MDLTNILKELCDASGVSGAECEASAVAAKMLKPYVEEVQIDSFNNVIATVKKADKGQMTLLLDAHIDQIGLIVTAIDDKGFLKVGSCGGVDRRLMLGQQVTILSKERQRGIVCTIPPHLSKEGDSDKVPEIDDIAIDVGLSADKAKEKIALGDRVIIDSLFLTLMENKISAKALDDRAGVASIIKAVSMLKDKRLPCGVSVLFSAEEETGERGAQVAGYNINPDIAVAVDVSFAHTPDADENKCGKLSKGVMIGISPTLDKKISDSFIKISERENIPYQLEVMSGSTGTNADVIGTSRGGVRTGLLSIPLRYMHTPIEVIDLGDVQAVSDLIVKFILSLEEEI